MDDMHKVVCMGDVSVQNQDESPQAKLPKIISDLFDKKQSSFDTHNMDAFVDLHKREDNIIVAFSFDDVLGIEDI